MFIFATSSAVRTVELAVRTGLIIASPPFVAKVSGPRRTSCVYARFSVRAASPGHMLTVEMPPCGVRKCTKHFGSAAA
jgi:hypothetical protein